MRNLTHVIAKLTKEEKRYFKLYLNRTQKVAGNKRVEDLFDLVNSQLPITDKEVEKMMFPTSNSNNFYQLKNRLLDNIEKTLFLLHINNSQRIKLVYQIGVAQIYTNKLLYKEAFTLYKKLEKKAIKGGYYDLLLWIYQDMVALAMAYQPIDLEQYLDKQMEAIEKYKESLQINQVLQRITYRLYQSNYAVQDIELNKTLENIKEKLQLKAEVLQSPKLQFEIHDCIKRTLLQQRNFQELATYLINSLAEFTEKKLYHQSNHNHKIVTIVWIINCLFKNFAFEVAALYIEQLHTALLAYNKSFHQQFLWTYYQCLVVQYFYSNQLLKVIDVLTQLSTETRYQGSPFHDVFIQLNLATSYFCLGRLDKAMAHVAKLLTKEKYNKLSKELQLRLAVVEIIFHFDNDDMLFLDYKVGETRKTFKKLLKQNTYARENHFLKLMAQCIQKLHPFKDKGLLKKITTFLANSPKFEPGSNEAINYKLWLQAKLNKRAYYEEVLAACQVKQVT